MAVTPPFAHKVNRVTILGDCFTSSEQWTTGFFLGNDNSDVGDPAGSAAKIATYWSAFFTHANVSVATAYRTLQVKVAQIKTDGHTDLDAVDWFDYATPVAGGSSSVHIYPPQIALAATITSNVQRGLAAKGRMYLPGVTLDVQTSSGKILQTSVSSLADRLKVFLDAINADVDIQGRVVLASHGHAVRDETGKIQSYANPINTIATGCRVGDVYDTQRRRRNDLPEVYSAKVLA